MAPLNILFSLLHIPLLLALHNDLVVDLVPNLADELLKTQTHIPIVFLLCFSSVSSTKRTEINLAYTTPQGDANDGLSKGWIINLHLSTLID